jgi:hypothetical protein
MTFQNYLKEITETNEIFCIQEWCNNRFIGTHLMFGIINDSEHEFDQYYFYQESMDASSSYIDLTQEVEFLEIGIAAKDHNGNRVELIFFSVDIIENPDPQ